MNKRPPIGIPPRFIVNEFRKELNNPFEIMTFDLRRFVDTNGFLSIICYQIIFCTIHNLITNERNILHIMA